MKVITIASGGIDSTVLTYYLAAKGYEQRLLSFNYGQRHVKELECVSYLSSKMTCQHDIINLSALKYLFAGSALTDNVVVPDGKYTDESMKVTIVPNRNAILLSIAYAVAVVDKAQYVAYGAHTDDYAIHPDCRPYFVEHFQKMEQAATQAGIMMMTPFLYLTKAEIVRVGDKLGVDFAATWSCYKGGDIHCGTCGACTARIEAFQLAGIEDQTVYVAAAHG